jgi:hypothetical protein
LAGNFSPSGKIEIDQEHNNRPCLGGFSFCGVNFGAIGILDG